MKQTVESHLKLKLDTDQNAQLLEKIKQTLFKLIAKV